MVAPADGKIVALVPVNESESRVSIFLNIFDVHVNRTPIPGFVSLVQYQRGKFINAGHEAASVENEQNTLIIQGESHGETTTVKCRQIAGLIARRIVCYKKAGDHVATAERIGYIKFGSRVDVLFGPEWQPVVKVGDRVKAGATVLARWNSPHARTGNG